MMSFILTRPLSSLLVLTPFTKRESAGPPTILKTVLPMNVKFCRDIFERLKIVKVAYTVITWYLPMGVLLTWDCQCHDHKVSVELNRRIV